MSQVESIAVVGAGQMGRGIAQVAAQSGYQVLVYDIAKEPLDKGIDFIKKQLSRGVEKGKWDQAAADATLNNLKGTTKLKDLKDADLIIEAATENKTIKFEIFKNLDEVAKDGAILASNTSSISITEIAAVTKRADKVVGMPLYESCSCNEVS
jgi:3-hydroxybutyryl-CoA dehydrogenase